MSGTGHTFSSVLFAYQQTPKGEPTRGQRHVVGSSREDDVRLSELDLLRRIDDRLEAASAQTVELRRQKRCPGEAEIHRVRNRALSARRTGSQSWPERRPADLRDARHASPGRPRKGPSRALVCGHKGRDRPSSERKEFHEGARAVSVAPSDSRGLVPARVRRTQR